MTVTIAQETALEAGDYIACLGQSALGPRRPLANPERVAAYLAQSNFVLTARDQSGALVGVFRGMTDWHWVCYCADLAVAERHQGQGIGRALMDKASELLGPGCSIVLLAMPGSEDFYRTIGLTPANAAFFRDRTDRS